MEPSCYPGSLFSSGQELRSRTFHNELDFSGVWGHDVDRSYLVRCGSAKMV